MAESAPRSQAREDILGSVGETEWSRLQRQIALADGFWLGFVFAESPAPIAVLRRRAKAMLRMGARTMYELRPQEPAQLRQVSAAIAGSAAAAAGCVWVESVRTDASPAIHGRGDGWTDAWDQLFLRLNERRDAVRNHLNGGLVFVANSAIKSRVRDAAPDLWSIRSIVLDLATSHMEDEGHTTAAPPAASEKSAGTRGGTFGPFGKITHCRVFVAAPSDVAQEREIARRVISDVSGDVGRSFGVVLEPCGWEDVRLGLGRPQALINPLVREADLFVGILWKRFGAATGVVESGTAEEFHSIYERSQVRGEADAMLYLRDVPPEIFEDPGEQLTRILAFRKQVEQLGLYVNYSSPSDFEARLRRNLTAWLAERGKVGVGKASVPDRRAGTDLRASRLELLDRFRKAQVAEHRYLQMTGFETQVRVPVELERVLVPLRARVAHTEAAYGQDKEDLEGRSAEDGVIELEQAWRQARERKIATFVVLGQPGSGKTTMLRHLLLRCIDNPAGLGLPPDTVPLFLPLRLVQPPENLDAAIRRILRAEQLRLPKRFFEPWLVKGQGLLLLDGLDEVRSAGERAQMARWIEAQRRAFPECPMLVTARFAGYVGDARLDVERVELSLERFRAAEIQAFLENWFVTVETAIGEDTEFFRQRGRDAAAYLWSRIGDTPELMALATNPLMLQIIALVHRDRGALPERRVELYDECINVLLEHWDRAKRGLRVPLTAKEARHVLRPVAYWMHQVPERRFASTREIVPIILQGLSQFPKRNLSAADLLDTVRDRSGLFTGHGVDEYGFQHLSFQEFLTAEEIRARRLFKDLVHVYGEVWWREVTRLLVALENPSCFEDFMRELVRSKRFLRHHDLTAACINDAFTPSVEPFAAALAASLDQRSAQPSVGVHQYQLLLAMRELSPEAIRPALGTIRKAVKSARSEVGRELATELLARAGVELSVAHDTVTGLPELRINPQDGMELVFIPGGEFLAGDKDAHDNQPRRMTLNSFYLARYPVTNAQYERFLEKNPDMPKPKYWDDARFNQQQQPVVGVSWDDAMAYCKWAGLRLPTEWEWEKGARATDGRPYPWGGLEPTATHANFDGNIGKPTPVGSYPAGASPYGLMDMAGNVDEWTMSEYRDSAMRSVRGGSFNVPAQRLRAASRFHTVAINRSSVLGFRCAQDPVAP